MKTVTEKQAVKLLSGVSGNTFLQVQTDTDPRMRKTGNPYLGARKLSSFNVSFGASYGNAVNRQADREDNHNPDSFKPEPLPWGEWVSGLEGKVLTHKGETYLRFQINEAKPNVVYVMEGVEIPVENLQPYLTKRSPSRRQKEHGNQKEVQVRAVKVASILGFTLNGEHYVVKH